MKHQQSHKKISRKKITQITFSTGRVEYELNTKNLNIMFKCFISDQVRDVKYLKYVLNTFHKIRI
jgi:hypothetical protein